MLGMRANHFIHAMLALAMILVTGLGHLSTAAQPMATPVVEGQPQTAETDMSDTSLPAESPDTSVVSAQSITYAAVSLVVVDWDTDQPISEADVVLQDGYGNVLIDDANTNGEGRTTFSTLTEGEEYNLIVSKAGYETRAYQFRASDGGTLSVALVAVSNGYLTVTVIDWDSSTPIPNASVQVFNTAQSAKIDEGTTNTNGVYVTSVDLEPGMYNLTVSAAGYHTRSNYDINVNGPTSAEVALVPATAGKLTVRAYDVETDEGVSGATITIIHSDTGQQVAQGVTEAEGTWIAPELDSALYVISVSAPGYFTREGYEHHVYGDETVNIALSAAREGTITVTVRNFDTGAVVPAASVTIRNPATGDAVASGEASGDGVWVSGVLPPGEYAVDVTAAGYADRTGYTVNHSGNDAVEIAISEVSDGDVTVTVTDWDTDLAIPNAVVKVLRSGGTDVVAQGKTDGQGKWISPVLTAGEYDLQVSADGYFIRTNAENVFQVHQDVSVALQPVAQDATIILTIVSADTGKPVPGATIVARYSETQTVVGEGTANASGVWISPLIDGGQYAFEVTADGYHTRVYEHMVTGDDEIVVAISPETGVTLTVRVRDAGQNRIPDAQVTLLGVSTMQPLAQGTTDANGDVTLPAVPQEGYYLEVIADGYAYYLTEVTLSHDQDYVTTLTSGNPGNTPVPTETPGPTEPPATPVPTETPGPTEPPVPTETPGSTQPPVTPVPTEPGTTPVPTPPLGTEEPPVTQVPGEETHQLIVRFDLPAGSDIAGVPYRLYAQTAAQFSTEPYRIGVVGSDSRITIDDLVPGTYRLIVEPNGMAAIEATIDVGTSATTELVIQVTADGGVVVRSVPPTPTPVGTSTSSDDTGDTTGLPSTGSGPASNLTTPLLVLTALAFVAIAVHVGVRSDDRRRSS